MKRTKELTVQEAALRLGVTLKYVRDLIAERKLEGARLLGKGPGKGWRIPAAAVEARACEPELRP
ncbi:MAG: excisionase family DNA-binding protein [Candidatus Acidiferrales bacterium]|jgi:excisionase family DNA binding protein